jgi:hypothetical protein
MSTKFIYPNVEPTLGADFANSKRIPPEFQFTRASTGTYVGSDGLIKTAVAGQPRFDCDLLTGDVKGLLVEESRTNLLTHSTQIGSGNLSELSGLTIQNNAGLAPDGTLTAVKLTETISNTSKYLRSSGGLLNPTSKALTIYVKSAERTRVVFGGGAGNSRANINVDLTTGNFVSSINSGFWTNVSFPAPVNVGNGWWRLTVIGTTPRGDDRFYVMPTTITTALSEPTNQSGSANIYEGDGISGILIWAPQIENGSYETSYIPTSNSTVTRAADILTVPTSIFLNTSKSSIVVESETTINNSPVISLNDGTTFNETKLIVYPTAGVSKLVTNDIVRSGLVLNLDAGNPASYPGSGTTWNDLSGNGNNGTLVNGVGYSSGNLGSLVFDGVDDYATIPHSSILNFNTALTISIWFYSGITTAWWLYLKGRTDADNYNPLVYSNGRYGWTGPNGRSFYEPPSGFIQSNTWYNLTVSHISGNNPNIYRNAVVSTSHTYSEGSGAGALGTNTNPVGINADVPRGTIGTFNGRIASIQAYNRALTAQEIQQNFNATKSRYI